MYRVKEIFLTKQGEGYHTGRDSVFVRFSRCNLWSGLEKDRTKAICNWCDTNFVGTDGINGGRYTKKEIVNIQVIININIPSCTLIIHNNKIPTILTNLPNPLCFVSTASTLKNMLIFNSL